MARSNSPATEEEKKSELIHDLLLGIRTSHASLLSEQSKNKQQKSNEINLESEMNNSYRMRFPPEGSRDTPAHKKKSFEFENYCPLLFQNIRRHLGFTLTTKEHSSQDTIFHVDKFQSMTTNSKGGQYFFTNGHLMLKSLKKDEYVLFKKILMSYYQYVCKDDNANTLLPRIYGLYRVKISSFISLTLSRDNYHFILMQNVFYPILSCNPMTQVKHLSIDRKYDLKGSMYNRNITGRGDGTGRRAERERTRQEEGQESEQGIWKDKEFGENNEKIGLGPLSDTFLEQAYSDIQWLHFHDIMDYSFLLGIHEVTKAEKILLTETKDLISSAKAKESEKKQEEAPVATSAQSTEDVKQELPQTPEIAISEDVNDTHNEEDPSPQIEEDSPNNDNTEVIEAAVQAREDSGSFVEVPKHVINARGASPGASSSGSWQNVSASEDTPPDDIRQCPERVRDEENDRQRRDRNDRNEAGEEEEDTKDTKDMPSEAPVVQSNESDGLDKDPSIPTSTKTTPTEEKKEQKMEEETKVVTTTATSVPSVVDSMEHKSAFMRDNGGIRSSDGSVIYFMGIIDILQRYNSKKKFEHWLLGFKADQGEISSVNPERYAERLHKFLVDNVTGDN